MTALALGCDIPWDYFNYHAYAVELLRTNRLGHDFFAAGLNGYFNPIGFVPLALARYWSLNAPSTAAWLASLHALNAFFLYLVCRDLSSNKSWKVKTTLGIGWLLGVTTPVFLIHLGSTFVDPIGSALVMASIWLGLFKSTPRHQLLAGLLAGIAVGVKLSNVCFALPLALTIALPRTAEARPQWCTRVGYAAIGMVGGFVLAQAWWSWQLQTLTGNPFFPMFNTVFESPYFSTSATGTQRFVPVSFADLISLPWRMARPDSWIYIEPRAPTLVPLVCSLAALALGIKNLPTLFRRWPPPMPMPEQRMLLLVAMSALLWIATSANGRYGITLFVLLGPCLAILLLKLLPQRYALLVIVLLTATQSYTLWLTGIDRWNSSRWTSQLVSVEVPPQLAKEPQLFLTLSNPSHTEIIPYLHPDSVYVNVRGNYSVPSHGHNGQILDSLIDRYQGRTQVLYLASTPIKGVEVDRKAEKDSMNALIDRLGLQLEADRCTTIQIGRPGRPLPIPFNQHLKPSIQFSLMSCNAVRTAPKPSFAISRTNAEKIMNAFEVKCPKLFLPRQPQIEGTGQVWARGYFNHDSFNLVVRFDKDMLFYGLGGQTSYTYLGKASEWREVVDKFDCQVPGRGKRGIDFFNENEANAIWF